MSPAALAAAIASLDEDLTGWADEDLTGWADEARRCADRGWHDAAQRIDQEHVAPLTEALRFLRAMQGIQQHGIAAFLPADARQPSLWEARQ